MEAVVDLEKLGKYLECSICLSKYSNPQQLTCRHQFCKECLDNILEFQDDGSAVINCPNRCREQTVIGKRQTTNDLGVSYEFKGMLEMLKLKDKKLDVSSSLCNYIEDCQKDVAVYCCGLIMCKSCSTNHNITEAHHQGMTDIFFDKKEKELKVLCKEHVSNCTHFCSDNQFLCVYCINRTHKQHRKDTIRSQAEKLKESLTNGSKIVNKINELLKVTKENILVNKEELDISLRERKIACLSSYLDFLNREEEVIRKQFQHLSCDHTKQYPIIDTTKCYLDTLQKNDIELVMEKHPILQSLTVSGLWNSSVSSVTVSLRDDFDFRNEHPLGDLQVAVGEDISFYDLNLLRSSFTGNISKVDDYENILSKLSKDIKTLLQEVDVREGTSFPKILEHVQDDTQTQNINSHPTQDKHDLVSESDLQKLEHVSIQGIVQYFRCKKNALLRRLVQIRPQMAVMRTKRTGDYPVHLAVKHNNLEILKEILKHGSAPCNVKNSDGNTILSLAEKTWGSTECFRWLVEVYPQLIDIMGVCGKTPLHNAAHGGRLDNLKYLLNHGADIFIKDRSGHNALDYAKKKEYYYGSNRNNEGKVNCLKELQRVLNERGQIDNGLPYFP